MDLSRFASKTTQPSISQKPILNLPIPLPPLQLQQKFAKFVQYFENKRKQMEKATEDLEKLYQTLLSKAFTGELTKEWREANKITWELPELTESQKSILAMVHNHQEMYEAPTVTYVMKEAFLLQQEAGIDLGYEFVPYKFGPFSKEVYEDLEALEKELLIAKVKESKKIERQIIATDEESIDDIKKILEKNPEERRGIIKKLVERYGKMEFKELLDMFIRNIQNLWEIKNAKYQIPLISSGLSP